MKIAFIGCVEFSYRALELLYSQADADIVAVVTREKSAFNSDFKSLAPLAAKHDTPVFFAESNDQEQLCQFIETYKPDVIYCFGWSYLLKARVLSIASKGVIGFHPAALPQNRGRHPIIWAIALGLKETASTFFYMDEDADSGDIISQVAVDIADSDQAGDLYQKITDAAMEQIRDFTSKLANNCAERIPQDHSIANTWRKRGIKDGEIDWRMSATTIHNLVRALSKPYVGAHFVYGGNNISVWRSEIATQTIPQNYEPGLVVTLKNNSFLVKCGIGGIWIHEYDMATPPTVGEYL